MRRFFSPTSFWNRPIGSNPAIDPESKRYLDFMAKADARGFWINLQKWTIPIYEVNRQTPRRKVHKRLPMAGKDILARSADYLGSDFPMGHARAFAADAEAGQIPIPDEAMSDPESDGHIALVDWETGWIWDMWAARVRSDGDWEANTGMKYRVEGSGVFDRREFTIHNGESIHAYGPSRAAGVPALAGTIMHQEILEGKIEHKLAFATQAAAFQKFVYPPACWTDGGWPEGLPEGAVLQLNPSLDLDSLGLSRNAQVVAEALQEYGVVCVDVGGGHTLYAEGLYADSRKREWTGVLDNGELLHLKLSNFRVLKMENIIDEGMGRRVPDGIYAG